MLLQEKSSNHLGIDNVLSKFPPFPVVKYFRNYSLTFLFMHTMRYDCSQYLVSFVSSHHHLFSFIPTSPLLSYSYIFVLFKDPKNPSHLSDLGFEILCWSLLGSPAMSRLIIVTPQFPESNRSCQFNMLGALDPFPHS